MAKFIVFFIILSLLVGFFLGVGWGAYKIAYKLISIGSEVLDIQLSDKAKYLLVHNPEIMQNAVNNYELISNHSNPFNQCFQYQAYLHYEECVFNGLNLTLCEQGLKAKYGDIKPFNLLT